MDDDSDRTDDRDLLVPRSESSERTNRGLRADRWSSKGYRRCLGFLGFLGILFLCGSLVLILTFRQIVEFVVRKEMVLAPGNEIFELWKDPPIPIHMSIYLFNITNKEDFPFNKRKPIVEELGPFVFREQWDRDNLRFYRNDTLSYRMVKTYFYEPTLSKGSLDDVVTGVNMPLLTAANIFKNASPLMKFGLSTFLRMIRESFISEHTVRQLLFEGYTDPLITFGKPFFKTYPYDKFGYFYGRNGSDIGNYNIFTGEEDSSKFAIINSWNGNQYLNVWKSKECNKIEGTDGSIFPPLLEPSRDVYAFISDICRSIHLVYDDTVERLSISAFRYVPSKTFMDNGSQMPGNRCFCSGRCLNPGVYNLSVCQFGAPVFLSYPHFYDADNSFLHDVIGMSPNKSLHQTHFILEPETGAPVEITGRFQLNAFIERIPEFLSFESLPTMLLPILWFEEGSSLDQANADRLIAVTQLPYFYGKIASYSLLVLGLVLGITAVLYFVAVRTQAQKERQNDGDLSNGH